MIPQLTKEAAEALGYKPARILPSGKCAGVLNQLFTVGLFVGLGDFYERRFCYPSRIEAEKALMTWDGFCDPPGPWIKEKPSNRLNPRLAKP
jgi:hypothetical protein